VPSLLAAPVLPVVPPTITKQHRQQQQQMTANTKKATTTTNASSLAQQKVIPPTVVTPNVVAETISTTNKQQQHTTIAPSRLQNALKNHASQQSQKIEPSVSSHSAVQPSSLNLWTNNNIHEHTSGIVSFYFLIMKIIIHIFLLFSNTTIKSTSFDTILYTKSYTNSTAFFYCYTNCNWWYIHSAITLNFI
jgi:hypothetical protein